MNAAIYDSSAVDVYILEQIKREQEITRTRSIENFAKEAPFLLLLWGGRLLAIGLLVLCIGYAIKLALSWHHIDETINSYPSPSVHTGYQTDAISKEDTVFDVEAILSGTNGNNQSRGSISNPAEITKDSPLPITSVEQGNVQDSNGPASDVIESGIDSSFSGPSLDHDNSQSSSNTESQQSIQSNPELKTTQEHEMDNKNNIAPPEEDTIRHYTVFDRIPFDGKSIKTVIVGRKFNEPGGPLIEKYCYFKVPKSKDIYDSIYFIRDTSKGRHELPITQNLSKFLKIEYQELLDAKSKCKI